MVRWALELTSGARIGLHRGITTFGRSPRCDVVVPDPAFSRRQLLACARGDAVEIINVGKKAASIGGAAIEGLGLARDGDTIEVDGVLLATVRRSDDEGGRPATRWCVRIGEGPLVGLDGALTIGGASSDGLRIDGWVDGALTLHPVDGAVVVESRVECRTLDGDGFGRLVSGGSIALGAAQITVLEVGGGALEATTVQGGEGRMVVRLEPFRSGGMIVVEAESGSSSVYLARNRFALLRALLSPAPAGAHGYVDVDTLCRAIWPDDASKDETDFNVLLYRTRRDLLGAGIDASAWVERERGSGMLRSPLRARKDVIIEIE